VGNTEFDLWLEISEIVGSFKGGNKTFKNVVAMRIGQPYLDYR
jgi:hypothetical protein